MAMKEDDRSSATDEFVELLAALDEAAASGDSSRSDQLLAQHPELAERLQRGRQCVEMLQHLRPHRVIPAAGDTPVGDETHHASHGPPAGHPLPEQFGRFEIRRLLGCGGFGIVYLAFDPRLHRDVALKVPRFEALHTAELRQRFQREARAGAGLDHPNVTAVYETGVIDGVTYIASAYCAGPTLAEWLREQSDPVPCRAAAALVAILAEATEHGHSRGVLHRDLKPGNILLSKDLASGPAGDRAAKAQKNCCVLGRQMYLPKITDFGLAKLLDNEQNTRQSAALGTPSYMAPEQTGTDNGPSTVATDVYGLGAVLYELLTGRPPFEGATVLETLDQIRASEPAPPRRLRPTTARDLETICLKCLQKEPTRRYASAADLARDLQRFLAGYPIHARRASTLQRSAMWCRRRPLVASLAATAAVCAVAALSVWTWSSHRVAQSEVSVEESDARADELGARLTGELQRIVELEEKVDVDRREQAWILANEYNQDRDKIGDEILRMRKIEDAVEIYQSLLGEEGDAAIRLQASAAYQNLALAQFRIGYWNASRQTALTAKSLIDPVDSRGRSALVSVMILIADDLRSLGDRHEAESQYREAADLARKGGNRGACASALAGQAAVFMETERYNEAKRVLREARDLNLLDLPPTRSAAAATPNGQDTPQPQREPIRLPHFSRFGTGRLLPQEESEFTADDASESRFADGDRAGDGRQSIDTIREERELLAKQFPEVLARSITHALCQHAEVYLKLASVHLACEEYMDAGECIAKAEQILSQFERGTTQSMWCVRLSFARQARLYAELDLAQDRQNAAEAGFEQSIDDSQALVRHFRDRVAFRDELIKAYLGLARLYEDAERNERAGEFYRKARDELGKLKQQLPDYPVRYQEMSGRIERATDTLQQSARRRRSQSTVADSPIRTAVTTAALRRAGTHENCHRNSCPFPSSMRTEVPGAGRRDEVTRAQMDATKRKALEAAGWKIGDAADFLEMSDEERQLLDARVSLALAIRKPREAVDLSQKELGARLKTSQPRVAKIERAASDVSLDQLVRAFTAAGGSIVIKSAKSKSTKGKPATVVMEVTTSK